MPAAAAEKPAITQAQKQAFYREKIRNLHKKGYKSVSVDIDGRLVVEVDDAKVDPSMHELYRRAWGLEWPTVRSEPWRDHRRLEEQLTFTSRG